MISASDLEISFGSVEVLKGVGFHLEPGSISGLIGPSGGGKSVLMKILGQVLQPDSGAVNLGSAADDVSLMFQEGALFDSLTVFDNVAFPLVRGHVPTDSLQHAQRVAVRDKVSDVLSRVGLAHAAFKMPAQLSGGMRRRVSLARAVVGRPRIALLDDPTSGLDPVASSVIMELIVSLHQEYRPTMVLVSHDLRRLLPVVDNVLALFDGRIQYQGQLSDLAEKASEEVKSFIACRYDFETDVAGVHT